jgi:hypothetical protein
LGVIENGVSGAPTHCTVNFMAVGEKTENNFILIAGVVVK